jgi:hypothetical protein
MTRPLLPDLLGAALASAGLALVPYPPPQTGTWTTKTGNVMPHLAVYCALRGAQHSGGVFPLGGRQ